MGTEDGYVIWDTERYCMWRSRKDQTVWQKPGWAKNAWNVHNTPKFSEQTRFVCKPVRFVDWKTGDYLT
jgi:hypothetical protein